MPMSRMGMAPGWVGWGCEADYERARAMTASGLLAYPARGRAERMRGAEASSDDCAVPAPYPSSHRNFPNAAIALGVRLVGISAKIFSIFALSFSTASSQTSSYAVIAVRVTLLVRCSRRR